MFLNTSHLSGRSGISRLMFTTLIVLLLMAVALQFGTVQAQNERGTGGTLRVAMDSPVNLDPATGSNDPEVLLNRTIYDYLVETLPDSTLGPNLAHDWDISDDGLTYTFYLVEGVTFHDDSAFTAADVVFTYNRLQEIGSPAAALMGEFEVEALDDYTVVFTLPQVNADFMYGVASRFAAIIQDGMETPNEIDADGGFSNFNGTGPFVLSEYSAGERAVFLPNENYWIEGQPYLASLEFLFIDDTLTQIDALRGGAVDFIFKLDVDQVAPLEDEAGITILEIATNQHPVIRIRSDEGALGEDVRIRDAFKLATNRQELLETVQEGYGVIGNNDPIGPLYADFYDGSIEQTGYDPAAACELIQEATGEDRLFSEFYVVDVFNYQSMAVALQQQWEQGCIDVNLLMREPGIYFADTEWLEVDLGITNWGDRPIPQSYLTEAYVTGGPFNETHFSDAEMDELVAQAAVTTDIAERAAVYSQISQVFAGRGPIVIPFFASMIGAVRDNVDGLEMHPFPGQTDFRTVSVSQ
jgi:peptide/nickel transport system substrate-binding protein